MSLAELSSEDKEKLKEFRGRMDHLIKNEGHREDYFFIRWLLARDMNLDRAEEMLLKSLEWRKLNEADGILQREEVPEKIRKRYMFAHFGEDKDGFPIILLPAGRHDHRIALEEFGLEQFLHWNIIWIEKIMQIVENARKKSGNPIFQYHEILDLEYYSVRQLSYKPAIDYILTTQRQFDENYPEILRTVTVINAPRIFPILFGFIKPLLTKQTLDKLSVFGTDEEKWKAHFREKFPMERFPIRWGGGLKGSDEFSSQDDSVWLDAPIPLRYFKEVEGQDEEGFLTVKVPARDKFKIELEIPEKHTRLEWKFQTEVHDIAFGISFDNPGEKNIPVERLPSQQMQEGSLLCNRKGGVTLIFDNKFSYTTGKNLRYKIEVFPPTIVSNGSWK